jgi:hypothetical protein
MTRHTKSTPSDTLTGIVVGFVTTILLVGALITAGLLVYLSYRFEAVAYAQIFGSVGAAEIFPQSGFSVAEGFSAAMNLAKIYLVYITAQYLVKAGWWQALPARLVRWFVVAISIIMTVLVLGGETISPGASERLEEYRAAIDEREETEIATIDASIEQQRQALVAQFNTDFAALSQAHFERVDDLQELIDAERLNGAGESFYGPRYQDLERNVAAERDSFAAASLSLRSTHMQALADFTNERLTMVSVVRERADADRNSLSLASVFESEEAQNSYLLRFLEIANAIAPEGVEVEMIAVTVFLSLILSLGIEVAPIIILGYVFGVIARAGLRSEEQTADQDSAPADEQEDHDQPSGQVTRIPRQQRAERPLDGMVREA